MYKVLQQYQRMYERGGDFIYDTGYLYLFGRMNNDYLIDLLLLSLCVVLAFSNAIVMEYHSDSWYLLSTTQKGKKKIIFKQFFCYIDFSCTSCFEIVRIFICRLVFCLSILFLDNPYIVKDNLVNGAKKIE